MAYDLEFEKPLAELEKRIVSLQRKGDRLKPDELRQLHEAERRGDSGSGADQGSGSSSGSGPSTPTTL